MDQERDCKTIEPGIFLKKKKNETRKMYIWGIWFGSDLLNVSHLDFSWVLSVTLQIAGKPLMSVGRIKNSNGKINKNEIKINI